MTINQTIDGVLVSRELLERLLIAVTQDFATIGEVRELRALLDAPVNPYGFCHSHTQHDTGAAYCPDCGEAWNKWYAAQPQGEPVAWLAQAVGKGGEVYRNKASTIEPTMRDIEITWGQGVIDRFTIVIKPLYAEQRAPVAGVHTMRSIMEAVERSSEYTVLTSNQCSALAVALNRPRPAHANPTPGTEPSGTHPHNDGLDEMRKHK